MPSTAFHAYLARKWSTDTVYLLAPWYSLWVNYIANGTHSPGTGGKCCLGNGEPLIDSMSALLIRTNAFALVGSRWEDDTDANASLVLPCGKSYHRVPCLVYSWCLLMIKNRGGGYLFEHVISGHSYSFVAMWMRRCRAKLDDCTMLPRNDHIGLRINSHQKRLCHSLQSYRYRDVPLCVFGNGRSGRCAGRSFCYTHLRCNGMVARWYGSGSVDKGRICD
jgi:hypothetical protein